MLVILLTVVLKSYLCPNICYLFLCLGKDAIKEIKTGGLQSTITDLETFTSYYVKIAAFTKVVIKFLPVILALL